MPVRKSFAARDMGPQAIKAWSYSRYALHKQCPQKFKFQIIDKIPQADSTAMLRGSDIHAECEGYLVAKAKPRAVPESMKLFRKEFEELRRMKKYLSVEQQWALREDWSITSWFGKDAWLRAKLDACYDNGDKRVVIDFKTGKVRKEHEEQLDLYAVAAFAMAGDHIETVDAQLWYLDQGEIDDGNVYTRRDAELLKKDWKKKTKKMLTDVTYKPNPSRLCEWCDYSKAKGGPCEF